MALGEEMISEITNWIMESMRAHGQLSVFIGGDDRTDHCSHWYLYRKFRKSSWFEEKD